MVVKAYRADIGFGLNLQVKKSAVCSSIIRSRSHTEMVACDAAGVQVTTLGQWVPSSYQNLSMIDTTETANLYQTAYGNWLNWPAIE